MAANVPTHYQYDIPQDSTRIALARTIGQSGESADYVERPNFLYAASNLRAIFERYYRPQLQTTSTTAIVLPLYFTRLSTTRDEVEVFTGASNATVSVGIYTTAGSLIGSAYTHTHSGSSLSNNFATYTGITSTDVLVGITIKVPTSGTAKLFFVRVLEEVLLAADLP
tara:strand:+ start:884 stop:1387 length:504 start_codon:yes stop_codon:yes gene_type:complete